MGARRCKDNETDWKTRQAAPAIFVPNKCSTHESKPSNRARNEDTPLPARQSPKSRINSSQCERLLRPAFPNTRAEHQ